MNKVPGVKSECSFPWACGLAKEMKNRDRRLMTALSKNISAGTKQAAEKLYSVKGTGFSPYINVSE